MLWPKKNSYKEFDNEKKFLRLENSPPPPPITFLMVRPLMYCISFLYSKVSKAPIDEANLYAK